MKRYDKILTKLNDLLIMNEEVVKIYAKMLKTDSGNRLKAFFMDRGAERQEFGKLMQNEIKKLGVEEEDSIMLRRRSKLVRVNFRNLLELDDERDLLNGVYEIEQLSVKKYNELLVEMNLPLSSCKLLIKQLDKVQLRLNLIKRADALFA